MTFLDRYDRYGWDYGSRNAIEEREVAWYLGHASEVGGPVLELACGTGRLISALAVDGHDVAGLDLSKRMLDMARARIAGLPAEVRERVTLVEGDMSAFDLDRRFGLAIVADNSFREVETREGLLAVLARVRAHLAPGGRFLVTERRFDPALYPGGVREHPWSEPEPHPETGAPVRRRIRVRFDAEAMRIEGEMIYREERSDGTEDESTFRFSGPAMRPADYTGLFAEAGFDARLRVGYEDREDDGREPMLCFVLRRP